MLVINFKHGCVNGIGVTVLLGSGLKAADSFKVIF